MDKLDDLVEMAEKADAVAGLMDAVNPHDILAIAEAFRELEQRAEAAWAEAKHQLGVNIVLSRHNQAIVEQRDKALTQLSELAKQEPDYFLNRIESSDKWGPETDLRIYESQLGASKSQDDHGGGIIELFTRAAPASDLVPKGWKLVPVEPTESMIVDGFESVPDEGFSEPDVWEAFQMMSGCQQAAYKARLCWSAMIDAAPTPSE